MISSRRPQLLLLAVTLCVGCPRRDDPAPAPVASASASSAKASASAAPSESASLTGLADEEVKPVYPLDVGKPDPLVSKLCKALHDLPEERRAACCKQPLGLVLTSECERNLGGAFAAKAVTLTTAERGPRWLRLDRSEPTGDARGLCVDRPRHAAGEDGMPLLARVPRWAPLSRRGTDHGRRVRTSPRRRRLVRRRRRRARDVHGAR